MADPEIIEILRLTAELEEGVPPIFKLLGGLDPILAIGECLESVDPT